MKKLITTSGIAFEIDWAAPVGITENIVFLAKIHGSDIDTIHNTFKLPSETETLRKVIDDDTDDLETETEIETYTGYTRYFGFSVETDGDVIVTLKKDLGA